MAGLRAILTAVARAVARDLRSLNSLAANNFFIFFMVFFVAQGSGASGFLGLLLGLTMLFPLAADPLKKVPPERLALWPLTPAQRVLLRLGSIALSPASWITLALLIVVARPWFVLQVLAAVILGELVLLGWTAFSTHAPQASLFRWAPRLPGVLGGLMRKNLRQQLSILDTYLAILLAGSSALYFAFAGNPGSEAGFSMTLMVTLALSTNAQCLFALDGPGGLTRYRLWPLRGWRVLLAKDLTFLAITTLLCLPLRPLAAISAALVALAIGHHVSVRHPVPQPRWRFTGGSLGVGIVQVISMFGAAKSGDENPIETLAVCALLWLCSLWFYGRSLDR